MNADILKPYLAEAVTAFPNEEVTVSINLSTSKHSVGSNQFQANIAVGNIYFWGKTITEAFAKAKKELTPEKSARLDAAKKLREQADRIASGAEPIPDAV